MSINFKCPACASETTVFLGDEEPRYTQAELDKRIKEACERQREIILERVADLDLEMDLLKIYALQEAILSAPLAGEE